MISARVFLFVSAIIYIGLGVIMGSSLLFLMKLFDFFIPIAGLQIFRVLMGIYIAFGILFLYGAVSRPHLHMILSVELVLLVGSILGCCYSILIDGYIHWVTGFLLLLHVALFIFCMYFLRKSAPRIQ